MMGCFSPDGRSRCTQSTCTAVRLKSVLYGRCSPSASQCFPVLPAPLLVLRKVRQTHRTGKVATLRAGHSSHARARSMIASLPSVPCSWFIILRSSAMDTQYPPHDQPGECRQLAQSPISTALLVVSLGSTVVQSTPHATSGHTRSSSSQGRQKVTPRFLLSMMEAACQVWRNGGVKVSYRFWS
ncbi:hypothetical protein BDV09DRAFT_27484 [Aspergillus tetrazonus]